jgi:UDP:flavonoid glycosyltransferase YjiC (YdhE family)
MERTTARGIKPLFVCEWGDGYGHLLRILSLVASFQKLGFPTKLIVPETETHQNFGIPASLSGEVSFRAPLGFGRKQSRFSVNYLDLLTNSGFEDTQLVCRSIESWFSAFDEYQPDLLVAEFAPTAMIAARLAGIPVAIVGTGFTVPPLASPMPSLHPWLRIPATALAQADARLIDSLEPVFTRFGSIAPRRAVDLFEGVRRYRCTLPALDHYDPRPEETYWGLVSDKADGLMGSWDSEAPEIFVYMRWTNRATEPILAALRQLGLRSLAVIPDLPEHVAVDGPSLDATRHLTSIAQMAASSRLAITEASFNTTAAFLAKGVPVLCFPRQLEQACLAYRLSNRGLIRSVSFLAPLPDLGAMITECLDDQAMHQRVRLWSSEIDARDDPASRIALDLLQ